MWYAIGFISYAFSFSRKETIIFHIKKSTYLVCRFFLCIIDYFLLLIILYRRAARAQPPKHAIKYIQILDIDIPHITKSNNCGPAATAGLNAHQEIPPAA
jgi:hypothetical protein